MAIGKINKTVGEINALLNAIENAPNIYATPAQVEEALTEAVAPLAEKDGTYPQMSVGVADILNTPSGSPMHSIYVAMGAVWNDTTGYWELNGLTDLTNEDMARINVAKVLNVSNSNISFSNAMAFASKQARTNIEAINYQPNNSRFYGNGGVLCAESRIEVLVINSAGTGKCFFTSLRNAFFNANYLKEVRGIIALTYCDDFALSFKYARRVENVNIVNTRGLDIWFNSPNISLDSLKFILNNCGDATFTLTVVASKYAEANADAEFASLLASKPNVTFASA